MQIPALLAVASTFTSTVEIPTWVAVVGSVAGVVGLAAVIGCAMAHVARAMDPVQEPAITDEDSGPLHDANIKLCCTICGTHTDGPATGLPLYRGECLTCYMGKRGELARTAATQAAAVHH